MSAGDFKKIPRKMQQTKQHHIEQAYVCALLIIREKNL